MMAVLSVLMAAVTLHFHGVIGQSAANGEAPLAFSGVQSLTEAPNGRVLFIGDDGLLYEIRRGRPVSTGQRAHGSFLDYDGKTLRVLGAYEGVWEINPQTLALRQQLQSGGGIRWGNAGVRPDVAGHPFERLCKFASWDPASEQVLAYDEKGTPLGGLFPLPKREGNCRIEGFGFLPGCGDLLLVTYWPDNKIHRFRPDGTPVVGKGWPVRRGFGYLRNSGGRIFHAGVPALLPLEDNMTSSHPIKCAGESVLTGYARQGEFEYVGTSQGLYVRKAGEPDFVRRLGGIPKLSALAIHDGFVFMAIGGKIAWIYLDGDEEEPFASSDTSTLRIDNGRNYKDKILDLAPDGPGWLKVATGAAGRWRFRYVPPVEYLHHRQLWLHESGDYCDKVTKKPVSERAKKLLASAAAEVPGGFEAGQIAVSGRWIVVEDLKHHRLLRFRGERK